MAIEQRNEGEPFSDPEGDLMEKELKLARVILHLRQKRQSVVVLSRNAMRVLLSLDDVGKAAISICGQHLMILSEVHKALSELISKGYVVAREDLIGKGRKNVQKDPPFTFVELTKRGLQVQRDINRHRIMVLVEDE